MSDETTPISPASGWWNTSNDTLQISKTDSGEYKSNALSSGTPDYTSYIGYWSDNNIDVNGTITWISTGEFNDSIEQKVIAEQNLERAKTEQEKLNLEVEQEAKRKIAEAEGIAKANAVLTESISDDILQKNMIDKWNGELPKVVGNSSNVFDVSSYLGE